MREGLFHEFAHAMTLAGREHVIVRFVLLQHEPHAFDEIAGIAPVSFGIQIPEKQLFLQTVFDRCHRARDLARHECFASDRAFVVEQNAV